MKTYARIEHGIVAEILTTPKDPALLFHKSLRWQEMTGQNVAVGWVEVNGAFEAPPAAVVTLLRPTLAELHTQLDAIAAEITRLSPSA